MRISLLLEREPLGPILESTLCQFLHTWTGIHHTVTWYGSRPTLESIRKEGRQPWLCNSYLNSIFVPEVHPRALDVVRREFARSLRWWLRPAQAVYVKLATSRLTAPWFAGAAVALAPPLPNASNLLILGGNQKLRVLDRAAGKSYAILKSGFPKQALKREIEARSLAEDLSLPVPRIEFVHETGQWFQEQYVCGTPLNRVGDHRVRFQATLSACQGLMPLLRATIREEQVETYVHLLLERARVNLENAVSISARAKTSIAITLNRLEEWLLAKGRTDGIVLTALTHGDFQPANILVSNHSLWLVDWEFSDRRQALFDFLALHSNARFPKGLVNRLKALQDNHAAPFRLSLGAVPQVLHEWSDKNVRDWHVSLFLLEELELRLQASQTPILYHPHPGLAVLLSEIDLWLRN